MFHWLRQQFMDERFPAELPYAWRDWLAEDVWFWGKLQRAWRDELFEMCGQFIRQRRWEASQGFVLTDRIRLSIAAQACLLVMHSGGLDLYERVRLVLVVPKPLRQKALTDLGAERDVYAEGMASFCGQITLAWASVRGGAAIGNDGRNVVFHEFAHALDFTDGVGDGTPRLLDRALGNRWKTVMTKRYFELRELADANRKSLLNPYGATNPTEFFAVATETYFEKAQLMRRRMPDLYDLLDAYYRHHPAKW